MIGGSGLFRRRRSVAACFWRTPPALALFRNRPLGQPNTLIDLVMIIALVFVGARYLVGDYSRRQLFWDGARATTTALLISRRRL